MDMLARGEPVVRSASRPTPVGISIGVGAACVVAGALVAAAAFPTGAVDARLALLIAVVAAFGLIIDDPRVAAAVAALGYLVFTGFLLNRYGKLTWDHASGVRNLSLFVLAAALGAGLRRVRRWAARAVPVDHDSKKESHRA